MADNSIIEGLDGAGGSGGSDKFGAFTVRINCWLDQKTGEYVVGWSILPDGVYFRKSLDKITLGALQRGGVDLTTSSDLVDAIAFAQEKAKDVAFCAEAIRAQVKKDLADDKKAKKVPEKYRKGLSIAMAGRKPSSGAGISGLDD